MKYVVLPIYNTTDDCVEYGIFRICANGAFAAVGEPRYSVPLAHAWAAKASLTVPDDGEFLHPIPFG